MFIIRLSDGKYVTQDNSRPRLSLFMGFER